MAAVFSLQVVLVARLLFLWCIFDSLSLELNKQLLRQMVLLQKLVFL